ncbi:hypothetical protein ACAG26_24235 [Mycobacterium sp. pUA109]|uniref:hypothetical protein n=1 Tax=Mycobacterium sp. pUA109 TaxID=3238982 RepID=UPI00351AE27E
MRIRSTKPEFWRSERIASVDWEDRLVLKGLESYVDDNGVGKDDIALIVGDLFQRDLVREPSRTLARLSEAISRLHLAGLVWRYEAKGTNLLYVSFWESIQRVDKPQAGRFPRPDGTMNYKDSEIRECLANPREASRTFAPGTGEQGNRGTGEISGPLRTEPHSAPPPTAAESATPGAELVREHIDRNHPAATKTALRIQASELLNTGTDREVVAAALQLWNDKPSVGNGRTILASLCSEVIKSRAAPAANGRRVAASDAAFAQAQALKASNGTRLEIES